jgi:hypothetical protein
MSKKVRIVFLHEDELLPETKILSLHEGKIVVHPQWRWPFFHRHIFGFILLSEKGDMYIAEGQIESKSVANMQRILNNPKSTWTHTEMPLIYYINNPIPASGIK